VTTVLGTRPGWFAAAPCGAACSAGEPVGTASRPLRWARMTAAVAVLVCLAGALMSTYPLGARARRLVIRAGARGLLWSLGVKVEPVGGPLAPGALVVANHESLLDIVAIAAVAPAAFVAKAEIFAGRATALVLRACGAMPIHRERLRELPRAVAAVSARLRAGRTVALFPEATTYCGAHHRGRFKPAFFQAAIDAGVPVVPVSLRYTVALSGSRGARRSAIAAYVGDDTAATTLARVIGARGVAVRVHATVAIGAAEVRASNRRELAERAQTALAPDRRPTRPRRRPAQPAA
jgi:1-acyl-sn-glycerol-3-phosphate acyltransferase